MHKGTAKVYEWDSASNVATLAYTVTLDRGSTGGGITPSTPEDQYIPCAGLVANEPTLTDSCLVQLNGDLGAGICYSRCTHYCGITERRSSLYAYPEIAKWYNNHIHSKRR